MRSLLLTGVAVAALAGMAGSASAAITITAPSTGLVFDSYGTSSTAGFHGTVAPPPSGISSIVFGTSTTGNPPAGVYSGNTTAATSPFAGIPLGSTMNYLVAEPNGATGGTVTINFTTPQTSFSLLWGSVDNYNSVTFSTGGEVVTGAQIAAADPNVKLGTTNEPVTISGLQAFTTLVVSTTGIAFEFDTAHAASVPEPLTVALLGTGLLGLTLVRRKRV